MTLDITFTYIATSNNDKSISIKDFGNGELIAILSPGDITTGMCFSNNCKKLITTTSEGCIIIWKLP